MPSTTFSCTDVRIDGSQPLRTDTLWPPTSPPAPPAPPKG